MKRTLIEFSPLTDIESMTFIDRICSPIADVISCILGLRMRSPKYANQKRLARALLKEFLGQRVSAAGVSYVVNSRTRTRRWLWGIAVLLSSVFMGYMTVKVVLEYSGYPKSLVREENIAAKLPFPAVTVCSINPLLNNNIDKTSVAKYLKLKEVLEKATHIPTNRTYRDKCYQDPLCQWSWFNDHCSCLKNPCPTEFCLFANSTHCSCSFIFCRDNSSFETCRPYQGNSRSSPTCLCEDRDAYRSWTADIPPAEGIDLKDAFHDPEVEEIVRLIVNGTETYDLRDIEDAILPTTDDLYEYGMNFDNMIRSCSFEGSRCYRENFTVLYHPKFGKCYMFNFLGSTALPTQEPLPIYNYGSSSGLQLILYINLVPSVSLLNDEIGVRMVIHDPRDVPFVAEYGVNIKPQDMTAIEVTLSTVERLGPPWGDCEPEGTPIMFDSTGSQYSILGCQKACRHYHLIKQCGCKSREFLRGLTSLQVGDASHKFCNIANETEMECMENLRIAIEKQKIVCTCKPACKETNYGFSVSSSQLNRNFYKTVKAIRTLRSHEKGHHNITNTTEGSTMVGLKVYYNTFQVGHDREVATYSWETLVANVGGNLGFFMGLTLVTFVELFEFLWDLLLNACRRNRELQNSNRVFTKKNLKFDVQ
ncbi:hypothetical protein JTE90_008913 [Oedothorax gibbosus]|uniref:Uncharacterized protein n=1 Tax=Oedothorax gibbosus TaxID=931172 RepID=A0AAV6UIC4_9ARAC|nr:hypothetical protein JTE90_008913 [Oedothorax gibbosus]